MMSKFYAGVGSRETPPEVQSEMRWLAAKLAAHDWTLRSGAAQGADSAFESGAGEKKEIYLPWYRFNGSQSTLCNPTPGAMMLAASLHPAWERCSQGARKLHARNCHQILGLDLMTPVRFVACWTVAGLGGGGTGQAIRLARRENIPVYDLGLGTNVVFELLAWLGID
jgi:hypothetical protein